MVLTKMKETAEAFLGKKIKDAVVTVPGNYYCRDLLPILSCCTDLSVPTYVSINEPTAAAIAYGLDKKGGEKNILFFFYLGGETFDASILTLIMISIVMYVSDGQLFLMIGENFDQRIMEYFIKLIKKKHGKDNSKDNRALGKLRRECERAKRALSNQHQVRMEIVSLGWFGLL
ncbi:unnamed protein product [Musa textilis]